MVSVTFIADGYYCHSELKVSIVIKNFIWNTFASLFMESDVIHSVNVKIKVQL